MDNGFKSGAADDDWDDDFDEDDETDAESDIASHGADGRMAGGTETTSRSRSSSSGSRDLPWILTRNSITDGREKTVQLHLQNSTLDEQREGKRDVENDLGEDVKKADLREAALLVGLRHSGEVADVLRDWGYAID